MSSYKDFFPHGDSRFKEVEPGKWSWFEEYVLSSADYVLLCPPDRTMEFGSGVFSFGSPRGTRGKFSGARKITVYGGGSIHLRVADGKGPCLVGIRQVRMSTVDVFSSPSYWESVRGGYESWKRSRR